MTSNLLIFYHSRDNSSRYERNLRAEVQAQVQAQNARFFGDTPCLVSLKRGIEAYLLTSGTTGKYRHLRQDQAWRLSLTRNLLSITKVGGNESRLVLAVQMGGGRV